MIASLFGLASNDLLVVIAIGAFVTSAIHGATGVAGGFLDADDGFDIRQCLEHAPADRLVLTPDCGLSQTARWAARQKLANMVAGVRLVREELGL